MYIILFYQWGINCYCRIFDATHEVSLKLVLL